MKPISAAFGIVKGPKRSITRQTLRKIAIRISLVVAVATVLSYWHVKTRFEQQAVEVLERYVEQRRVRESAIFDLASGNVRTFAEAYQQEIRQTDPRDAEQRFATLFEARPDGTTRLTEAVFKSYGLSGFIGKHVAIDRDLKRRLMVAFDLVRQYGPAWASQFANLYVVTPEGAVIMYWPGQPWALKASDWEISGKTGLLSEGRSPVLVAGVSNTPVADKERWSELYLDYGTNEWLVSVTRPAIEDGRPLMQVGQDILMHDLIGRAVNTELRGTHNLLFTADGRLIAHPRFMDAIQARSGSLPIADTGDPHLTEIHRLAVENTADKAVIRNEKYDEIVALTKLSGPGWILATIYPLSLSAQDAWQAARIVLIMGALALLVELFILSTTLKAQIASPLRELVRATGSIAEGRFGTQLKLDRDDELGDLAQAFTAMARQVDAREMALRERSASLAELNIQLAHQLAERERTEKELARHRELNVLLDTIDYGILFLDADLKVRLANRAYKSMWGLPEALVAKDTPFRDLVAHTRKVANSEVRSGEIEEAVDRVLDCNGEPIEIGTHIGRVLRYQCITLPDGGRMLTYFDVTDQKRALEAVAAAEQRQRRLLELAPFPLAVTRLPDGLILYANARTAEITGLSPEEMQGTFAPEYYADPTVRHRLLASMQKDGRVSDMEVLMQRPDGQQFWALINASVADYEGTPALLSAFNNISELKRREEQLESARAETESALRDLNAVLDTIQYGVLFLDPFMRIRLANRAYRELWDIPASFYDRPRELEEDMELSRALGAYDVPEVEWETYKERRLSEIHRGNVAPVEMRLRNGKIMQYQCIALPDGGRMLTYFDITELKRIEEVLRRHLAAMEAAMDGMAILRPDGTYEYLNAAHLKIFGYDEPSELVGSSWKCLYTDPERQRLEVDAMPKLFRDGHWSGEAVGLKRDGSVFPQDVSLTVIQDGGLICVVRDISERHARDEALREAMDRAERANLAKSQFLANMSHELRTPLNAVIGYTELLIDGLYGNLPEKAQGVLERVQANGSHLLALINDVLDLSKIEAGELSLTWEPYSISGLVQTAITAMEPLAKVKGLEIRSLVPGDLPAGVGDERRLTQVLLNLIGNAIKFTPTGSIDIETLSEGGRLRIFVADTGVGIASDELAHIFGAFQQGSNTSSHGQGGTGLGLAISKRIIEMHGGSIDVRSEVGCGSTFIVEIPLDPSKARKEVA